MHIVWQLTPSERLKEWKEFRGFANQSTGKDKLQTILDWWILAPLSNRVIDPYTSDDWPDPWELLWNGQYDENTIALGMAYTLELCDWPCEILLIQDPTKSHVGIVIRIDNKFVLNHNYGLIDDATALDKCEILNTWYSKDLVK